MFDRMTILYAPTHLIPPALGGTLDSEEASYEPALQTSHDRDATTRSFRDSPYVPEFNPVPASSLMPPRDLDDVVAGDRPLTGGGMPGWTSAGAGPGAPAPAFDWMQLITPTINLATQYIPGAHHSEPQIGGEIELHETPPDESDSSTGIDLYEADDLHMASAGADFDWTSLIVPVVGIATQFIPGQHPAVASAATPPSVQPPVAVAGTKVGFGMSSAGGEGYYSPWAQAGRDLPDGLSSAGKAGGGPAPMPQWEQILLGVGIPTLIIGGTAAAIGTAFAPELHAGVAQGLGLSDAQVAAAQNRVQARQDGLYTNAQGFPCDANGTPFQKRADGAYVDANHVPFKQKPDGSVVNGLGAPFVPSSTPGSNSDGTPFIPSSLPSMGGDVFGIGSLSAGAAPEKLGFGMSSAGGEGYYSPWATAGTDL